MDPPCFRDLASPAQRPGRVLPREAGTQEVTSWGGRVCLLRLVHEVFSGSAGPWVHADHAGGPASWLLAVATGPLLAAGASGDAAIATV